MANPPQTKPTKPTVKRRAAVTPEGDREGYSYGRGKGTPTMNLKKGIVDKSARDFRAGERSSAAKPTGRSNAKKVVRRGATVGDAINAVGKAVGDTARGVNKNIQGALKSSPGLKSKGIENVMKLPAKKK